MAATAPRTACLSWRGMAEARHQRPKVCPSYREGFLFPFPFPNPHAQQEMGSLWRAGRFSPDPHPQLFLPHAVTCSCSLPQSHFGALCRASPLPPITAQLPAHWAQTELPHGCPAATLGWERSKAHLLLLAVLPVPQHREEQLLKVLIDLLFLHGRPGALGSRGQVNLHSFQPLFHN